MIVIHSGSPSAGILILAGGNFIHEGEGNGFCTSFIYSDPVFMEKHRNLSPDISPREGLLCMLTVLNHTADQKADIIDG